jgi:hypothetical protein
MAPKMGWSGEDFQESVLRIRSHPTFEHVNIWTVEHRYDREYLWDGSNRSAQLGLTPQLWSMSTTAKEQYRLQSFQIFFQSFFHNYSFTIINECGLFEGTIGGKAPYDNPYINEYY